MNIKKSTIKGLIKLLPILSLAICISCNNSDFDKGIDNNYDNPSIPVNVNIEGVSWENETPISRSMTDEIKKTVIPINEELELIATLEPDYSVTEKTRASTSLANGIAYRVIAYKQNGAGKSGDYVAHADFKIGTPPNEAFYLPWGCTYDIVCYSNGTGTLGAFDKETHQYTYASGNMPLYCKTTLTIPVESTTIPLNITLKHVDSMVQVIVKNATNNFSITNVSGVTAKAHYNTINVKLSSGHRSNPGGTSSSQSITMKTPSSGVNNQSESDYISIFSHDDVLSTVPSININTIKLKNGAGKEYTVSNKSLNGPSKWASGSRYKVTFVLKATDQYTITTSIEDNSDISKYANIRLTNISGGTTTANPANTVTFTGPFGSYATAGYEYKTGADATLNQLKHYHFSNWTINKGSVWEYYSADPTILLEQSKEKNGYRYKANFNPDRRTINYNWVVAGYSINGATSTNKYEKSGSFQQAAYQPLYNFHSVGNGGGIISKSGWLLVIGSKTRTGWRLVYQVFYGPNTGWALGLNDSGFVPFDDLPGDDPNTRTHEIRIYVRDSGNMMIAPKSDAEWENFDTWINNNK